MAEAEPGLAGTGDPVEWRRAVGRFGRHRLAMGSLVVLVLLAGFAFVGSLVWPYGHTLQRDIPPDRPPSLTHPFGTTRAGHDVMGQVMRGTQQSLKVGFLAAAMTTGIGTAWGAVAGFYRGWVDRVLMRVVDVVLMVPLLVVVLVLAGASRGTTWLHVAVTIGLFGWAGTARVVRGVVLSLREEEFVDAARVTGASDLRVIARHVLPNTVGVVIVDGTLVVAAAILLEAALSFLGLGITAPDTSLGLLVESARGAVFTRPWLFYIPGAFLVVLCLAVNFVGDGLRDALHPRRSPAGRVTT